jgi:hypothetical protein
MLDWLIVYGEGGRGVRPRLEGDCAFALFLRVCRCQCIAINDPDSRE